MHSLARRTPRSWATTTCATKPKRQAFSTCRPSKDDDVKRMVLPYQSVGWVSLDLKNVKHEPWMNVRKATFSEDEIMQRRQARQQGDVATLMEEYDADEVARFQNQTSVLQAPFPDIAKAHQSKVTTLPGALMLAKSSSGLRRTIGRDLLPPLENGLPPPAGKPLLAKRARLFVPMFPGMSRPEHEQGQGSSSSSALSSSSGRTRGQPVRAHPLHAVGDESLEEHFETPLTRDSSAPCDIDSDEHVWMLQRRRRPPENISGWRDEKEGDSEDNYLSGGADDRPDFIPVDPSRLPRVGSMSNLPRPADIVAQSSDAGEIVPGQLRGSSRLWRSSPIILKQTYRSQARNR